MPVRPWNLVAETELEMQPKIQDEIVSIVLRERMLSVRGAMQLFAQEKRRGTLRRGEEDINEEELQGSD